VLRQPYHDAVPFLDHFLQVRGVAVTQLLDGVDANALEELLVLGPDPLELVKVVRYVFGHCATLPVPAAQQCTDGVWIP
jgi:hypothetical protein